MAVFSDAENSIDYIREVLDSAPVLSDEKRDRITKIFVGGGSQ